MDVIITIIVGMNVMNVGVIIVGMDVVNVGVIMVSIDVMNGVIMIKVSIYIIDNVIFRCNSFVRLIWMLCNYDEDINITTRQLVPISQ